MTLEARGISVRAGPAPLLEEVSIEVRPGETVAVVGANGAGKSTLLRALAGEITPQAGEVVMAGRRIADWPLRARARVRAVLPQASALAFPFTAFDVARMGRDPHRGPGTWSRDEVIARAALEAAGVGHLADRLYPSLSGGERQRVQLARVLAQVWEAPQGGSRYLLLDEPTASLDLAHQLHALEVARRFAGDGVAVLAVLHDLNLAAAYADRVVVLKGGRRLADGPPESVLTSALIRDAFGAEVVVMKPPRRAHLLVIPRPRSA